MKQLLNHKISAGLLLILICCSFGFGLSVQVKQVTIYYTPFKTKLRVPIKAKEIESRSEYKLIARNPSLIGLGMGSAGILKSVIAEFKEIRPLPFDSLFTRSKVIFDLEKGKDIILYVGETGHIYYEGKLYEPHEKISDMFRRIFAE